MRVFITGATGYVGRAVVARLLQDGAEVVALVRSRARARDLEARGARLVVADISDVERVFLVGVDAVVHCAFSLFPASDPRVNVEGSLRLMRVAADAGVARFVFTSSSLVYGPSDPREPVTETHACRPRLTFAKQQRFIERALLELATGRGFPAVILRPSEVWGGRGGFFDLTVERLRVGTLFLAREDTQLSLTELPDLVEAVALALRRPIRPGEIFNICAPVGVSTAALYAGLAAILRVAPPRRLPKPAIFAAGALCQGLFEAVGAVPPFNLDIARLATMRAGPRSIDCARTRLGFEPRWPDPCAAILAAYAQREAQTECGSTAAVRM